MKIEVLGTGCQKCNKLYEAVREAVKVASVEAELVKVDDLALIMKYGVLMTPALVVDGKVVLSGRVPSPAEIAVFLR
jgi:small redox-active disulfide protein 2